MSENKRAKIRLHCQVTDLLLHVWRDHFRRLPVSSHLYELDLRYLRWPVLLLALVGLAMMAGVYTVMAPNHLRSCRCLGKYIGTGQMKRRLAAGTIFFYSKSKISKRVRPNFESGKLKVNERDGSPIEIAAIVVWKCQTPVKPCSMSMTIESFRAESERCLRSAPWRPATLMISIQRSDQLRSHPDDGFRKRSAP